MGHLSAAAGRPEVPALPEAVQVQGRPQLPHHGRAQCQGTPGPSRLPPASLNPRPPPPRPPRPPGPQRTVPALGPPRPRHGRGRSAEAGPAPQPSDTEAPEGSEQEERERLRKVLKQMGRLRCPQEVGAALQGRGMGGWGRRGAAHSPLNRPRPPGLWGRLLQPHGLPVPPAALREAAQRGGQPVLPLRPLRQDLPLQGRPRLPRAVGAHGPGERPGPPALPAGTCAPWPGTPAAHLGLRALQPLEEPEDKPPEAEDLLGVERTPSGRIRRTSAQVAVFHLQEIAEDELARDWTKRRMKDDLVPETARVRPGPSLHVGPPVRALSPQPGHPPTS